jgi:hypothetical protein
MRESLLALRLDELHVESFTIDPSDIQSPSYDVHNLPEMDSCGDWCQDTFGGTNN